MLSSLVECHRVLHDLALIVQVIRNIHPLGDRARAPGIELDVYSVNDTDTMDPMIELGVDNLITDSPLNSPMADSGAFTQMAATMKRAAVQVSKICNDLRWLSSDPRC